MNDLFVVILAAGYQVFLLFDLFGYPANYLIQNPNPYSSKLLDYVSVTVSYAGISAKDLDSIIKLDPSIYLSAVTAGIYGFVVSFGHSSFLLNYSNPNLNLKLSNSFVKSVPSL